MPRAQRQPVKHQQPTTAAEDDKAWYRRNGPIVESFPEQRAAALSQRKYEVWQCDRRAGKTSGVAIDYHVDSLERDYTYLYISKTKESAKGIVWREFGKFFRRYDLGWEMMIEDLSVRTPSGAILYVRGADSPDLMERLHGLIKLRKVWIDEAAFWRGDLGYLVDEVLSPALADVDGKLRLMSRPGNIPSGYFHDAAHGIIPGWHVRKWSWRDNPYMREAMEKHLALLRAKHPGIEKTASYRKNYCNEWVTTSEGRVYAFEFSRNDLTDTVELESESRVAIGVDFGWHDPTAFVVLAYVPSRGLVVLDSYREEQMLLDAIAARLREYLTDYPNARIVADPARTQFIGELRVRYGLAIAEAEKTNKRDWIGSVNSDFVAQTLMVHNARSHPLGKELVELHWQKMSSGRVVEQHGKRNDCADAMLYAYRTLFPLLRKPVIASPDARTMLAATERDERIRKSIAAARVAARRRA